jgi:hypothetical protein
MSQTENRKLERVRYWQGQMLRSRDFNNIHAAEEQRRWWHNRALHNAYGVYQDTPQPFFIEINADKTAVTVTPGLAYDSFGRELILQAKQTVPLPAGMRDKDEFLLLIRYRTPQPNECRDNLSGACYTDDMPPRPGFAEFIWKRPEQCSFTDGVPLITLVVDSSAKDKLSLKALAQSPSVRPLARPQLGSGYTVPGNTPWDLWTSGEEFAREQEVYGVQTRIDTSAAGFTESPCYFAWLQGDLFSPQTGQLAVAMFTSIAEESLNSFIFRIAFPQQRQQFTEIGAPVPTAAAGLSRPSPVTAREFALFAHRQNLYVNWVGCQKNASAPFFFAWLRNPALLLGLDVLRFANVSIQLKHVLPDIEML